LLCLVIASLVLPIVSEVRRRMRVSQAGTT
jgi:hypothetical protein